MKDALLTFTKLGGGFAFARRLTRRSLRILGYHGLWTTPGYQYGDKLFMTPEQFEARMTWLAASGYPVLGLGEAVDRLAGDTLPDNAVVITIDDGWKTTYTHMLPVLERLGLPATVYVSTYYVEHQAPVCHVAADYIVRSSPLQRIDLAGIVSDGQAYEVDTVDKRNGVGRATGLAIDALPDHAARVEAVRNLALRADVPVEPWWSSGQFHYMSLDEVRDAKQRGLDVQLHTHRHKMRRQEGFLFQEIADNRAALSVVGDCLGLQHFCYPSGNHDEIDEAVLAAGGIRSATLIEEGINPPGTHPLRLRRFLDGRSISQITFEAYLSGALELLAMARRRNR